jgi:hypothetical protein
VLTTSKLASDPKVTNQRKALVLTANYLRASPIVLRNQANRMPENWGNRVNGVLTV